MTMPFWEPIPYTVWLMHCKKLRAQTPTGNPLKAINSEYVLYLTKEKNYKAFLYFYALSHFPCYLPFLLQCLSLFHIHIYARGHTHRHTYSCMLSSYLPCVYPLVSFTSHTLHQPAQSFKSGILIAKSSSR